MELVARGWSGSGVSWAGGSHLLQPLSTCQELLEPGLGNLARPCPGPGRQPPARPIGERSGNARARAYLLSGTIEGSALLFYLARPAGKRVPWGRGCTGAASGAARRGGVCWQSGDTDTDTDMDMDIAIPRGSAGEFPSG